MPQLTVVGAGNSPVDVSIKTSVVASVAAQLLDLISNQVAQGKLTPFEYDGIGPVGAPSTPAYMIADGPGAASLPSNVQAVVDVAKGPVLLFGGTASTQSVVADSRITYVANTGVGTVIASGGHSVLTTPMFGAGAHLFVTEGSHNEIFAWSGNDTVETVDGRNSVVLGSGNDLVVVDGGNDSLIAGSGNDTVDVIKGSAVVLGGTGSLYFANTGGHSATVFGTTGSVTVQGGMGGGVYRGGAAGNNMLTGGLLATTLFGGGNNDLLIGESLVRDSLVAGTGNETLLAAGSGTSTLFGGKGADSMVAMGAATFVGGGGGGTMTGGFGNTMYEFIDDRSQGHFVVTDFMQGLAKIRLAGFSEADIHRIIAHQVDAGGSVTLKLGDQTTVTFLGTSRLDQSAFTGSTGPHEH